MRVVLDTNVLVSALRSRQGAANELLARAFRGEFVVACSTSLLAEYEDVLLREGMVPAYSPNEIDEFLDAYCAIAEKTRVFFRLRPILPDPKDELVLECAFAAGADYLVTHNCRDFNGGAGFVSVMTPRSFLAMLKP